ncbi:MAG: hypothetical protein ABIA74_00280 [bacterium]
MKIKIFLFYIMIISLGFCSFYMILSFFPLRYLPGKNIFYIKDTFIKPRVLFHASKNKNIKVLEPKQIHGRSKEEGKLVFATTHIGFASIFMSRHEDSWQKSGSFDNGPFYFICSDKERFLKEDIGGAIYVLSSKDFYADLTKGIRINEWVCRHVVKPLTKLEFDSTLNAMMSFGVQVYFVDKEAFNEIKTVKDYGRKIIMNLKSENEKKGINPMPLFDYNK